MPEATSVQEVVARHLCALMDDEWRLGRKLYMSTAAEILADIAYDDLLSACRGAAANYYEDQGDEQSSARACREAVEKVEGITNA